ncbi:MAG TPA: CHAT domain-containing protein [Oculatellaceae cyanobacterium]|jgi:CHAT domain-containing protein
MNYSAVLMGLLLSGLTLSNIHPAIAQVPTATNVGNVSANFDSLVQQGRNFYEFGKFLEAANAWKEAASAFAQAGDQLNQAMVLSNLSLAYQQLGQWSDAENAIASSLKLLGNPTNQNDYLKVLAQALNNQGSLQLAKGQAEQAVTTWVQAAKTYQQAGDQLGTIRAKINQSQAFLVLGLYRRALDTLQDVNKSLQSLPDSRIKAAGMRSLGNSFRLVGNLDQSKQILQQSLAVAERLRSPEDIAEALFSLGNTARAQQDNQAALAYYQQTINTSTSSITPLQAQLNQLSLLIQTQQISAATALSSSVQQSITKLPPSRNVVDAKINLAQSLMKLADNQQTSARITQTKQNQQQTTDTWFQADQNTIPNRPNYREIAQLLATAVQQANSLDDPRAESYALGQLGTVYENTRQFSDAIKLTEQALLKAQSINAPDIAYRWQWQLGRLLKAQKDTKGAIASYTEAVNNLQSLRTDLVAINSNVQFSFRESVEPVYRELVGLLLQSQPGVQPSQENLIAARKVIESLQLAELANFFRENCLTAKPVQIDQVDKSAAVVYPIILEDSLEVVLSLPGKPLLHYSTQIPRQEVETTLDRMRKAVVTRSSRAYLSTGSKIYDWLVKPAVADLTKGQIKTLVFVLDGRFANVPMAALYDGKQFLLEKYAIALTPSLQLFDPKPLEEKKLQALIAGISQARQKFSALPNVTDELATISSEVPTKVLLNQDFTSTALKNQLSSSGFSIVHLATHGQFSSQADQTFLLTWDETFNVNELNSLLRSREQAGSGAIELLVLSACQTAAGDKRAALGLAGVAVRAGARSTLATLWFVSDEGTTELMTEFYRELDASVTKAEALRRAQLRLLKDPALNHPYYWAPYVMVGNWL